MFQCFSHASQTLPPGPDSGPKEQNVHLPYQTWFILTSSGKSWGGPLPSPGTPAWPSQPSPAMPANLASRPAQPASSIYNLAGERSRWQIKFDSLNILRSPRGGSKTSPFQKLPGRFCTSILRNYRQKVTKTRNIGHLPGNPFLNHF